jgi:hypothetical protein
MYELLLVVGLALEPCGAVSIADPARRCMAGVGAAAAGLVPLCVDLQRSGGAPPCRHRYIWYAQVKPQKSFEERKGWSSD